MVFPWFSYENWGILGSPPGAQEILALTAADGLADPWIFAGFHQWGYPNSWLVFVGEIPWKSHENRSKKMDDLGLPPWLWLWKSPYPDDYVCSDTAKSMSWWLVIETKKNFGFRLYCATCWKKAWLWVLVLTLWLEKRPPSWCTMCCCLLLFQTLETQHSMVYKLASSLDFEAPTKLIVSIYTLLCSITLRVPTSRWLKGAPLCTIR